MTHLRYAACVRAILAAVMAFSTMAFGIAQSPAAEPVKVVALHPLMADLARQVGGEHVEVITMMKAQDDPHHFNPTPGHAAPGARCPHLSRQRDGA